MNKKKYYKKQLRLGIKTELEHKRFLQKILRTRNRKKILWGAKQIAKDHLKERKNYYSLMKKYRL